MHPPKTFFYFFILMPQSIGLKFFFGVPKSFGRLLRPVAKFLTSRKSSIEGLDGGLFNEKSDFSKKNFQKFRRDIFSQKMLENGILPLIPPSNTKNTGLSPPGRPWTPDFSCRSTIWVHLDPHLRWVIFWFQTTIGALLRWQRTHIPNFNLLG